LDSLLNSNVTNEDFGSVEELGPAEEVGNVEVLGLIEELAPIEELGPVEELFPVEELGPVEELIPSTQPNSRPLTHCRHLPSQCIASPYILVEKTEVKRSELTKQEEGS
jgi:hypothetical protein